MTIISWNMFTISTKLLQENNAISNQESIGSGPGKHEVRMEDSFIHVILNLNLYQTAKPMKI